MFSKDFSQSVEAFQIQIESLEKNDRLIYNSNCKKSQSFFFGKLICLIFFSEKMFCMLCDDIFRWIIVKIVGDQCRLIFDKSILVYFYCSKFNLGQLDTYPLLQLIIPLIEVLHNTRKWTDHEKHGRNTRAPLPSVVRRPKMTPAEKASRGT